MAATLFETLPDLSACLPRLMSCPNVSYNIFIDEVDNVDYRYEIARLESYKNWPVPYMKPKRLAAAGFYFTGEADIVKCFDCGISIYKWLEGDDPMVDHERESPTCRFIREIPCGNVPIDADLDNVPSPESKDECGPYDMGYDHPFEPYCDSFLTNLQSAKAKCPEYESNEDRLRTYESWSKLMPPSKEQLSAAGFYYTGRGDQVLCYHCGVGVKDWEPDDDPWEQHAIWFPSCNYLLTAKGREYVKNIAGQSSSEDMASYVTKVEQSIGADEPKENVEDCHPGPSSQSSQGSHDSGIESMSSNNSSVKGSLENLSDAEASGSKTIDDARACKICYNEEMCKLFIPCGHLMACAECAKHMKTCPICRRVITDSIKVFFS